MSDGEGGLDGAGAGGGRSVADIVFSAAVLLGIFAIPLVLLLVIMRPPSGGLKGLIEQLPERSARRAIIEMGPGVVPRLIPLVYKADNPDAKQLAIINIIFKLQHQDDLPIFVRRAYFAKALDESNAESRLFGLRGLMTIGPPRPLPRIADLLDDHRQATVHGSPGLPYAIRRKTGLVPGVVSDAAADILAAEFRLAFREAATDMMIPPTRNTASLRPELKKLRIKKIKEHIAKLTGGKPPRAPEGPPAGL